MVTRSSIIAFFWLLLAGSAVGQLGSQASKLSILLPSDVPSNKLQVHFYLYDSFGANGGSVPPMSDLTTVEIPLSVEGKVANAVKLFAWALGCQIATYDLTVQDSDLEERYICNPLATLRLHGQIADNRLLRKTSSEIRVDYLANWACDFFGFSDCMVPQISLGSVNADADGRFEIELPDFARDPVSADSKSPSGFQFLLREAKTWNLIALLDPELNLRLIGGELRPALSYPQSVVFTARKTN